jgi:hypothetical protein
MIKTNKCAIKITLLVILITASGCGEGDGKTTLDVQFVSQPSGGSLVNTVSADFSVDRNFEDNSGLLQSSASPRDITLRAEWVFEAGDRSFTEVVARDQLRVTDGDRSVYSYAHSAGENSVLLNYYYLELSWEDDNGFNQITSDKAFFTAPSLTANEKTSRSFLISPDSQTVIDKNYTIKKH